MEVGPARQDLVETAIDEDTMLSPPERARRTQSSVHDVAAVGVEAQRPARPARGRATTS